MRALGISQVWEVAFGAELISQEYAILARQAIRAGRPVVSTPCPAIVSYVEKYLPALKAPCPHRLSHDRHGPGNQAEVRGGSAGGVHRAMHRQEGGDRGPLRAGDRGCGADL